MCELRCANCELRCENCEVRIASCELRCARCELQLNRKPQISNLKSPCQVEGHLFLHLTGFLAGDYVKPVTAVSINNAA